MGLLSFSTLDKPPEQEHEPTYTWLDIEFSSLEEMTQAEAVQFLSRVSQMYDQLPPQAFSSENLDQFKINVENWLQELAPEYIFQGFTQETSAPTVQIVAYDLEQFSLRGNVDCVNDVLSLNERLATVFSEPGQEAGWLWWTTHEASHHYARMCYEYMGELNPLEAENQWKLEATASVMALEVLAAMARDGNVPALYAFLFGLRDMAANNAFSYALADANWPALREQMAEADIDPIFQAVAQDLDIDSYPITLFFPLRDGLRKYGRTPLNALLEASRSGDQTTDDLFLFNPEDNVLQLNQAIRLEQTLRLLENIQPFIERAQRLEGSR